MSTEPTHYGRTILIPLAKNLGTLVDADFLEDDVNKGFCLSVRPTSKRYPLNQVGSELELRLEVFNGWTWCRP